MHHASNADACMREDEDVAGYALGARLLREKSYVEPQNASYAQRPCIYSIAA